MTRTNKYERRDEKIQHRKSRKQHQNSMRIRGKPNVSLTDQSLETDSTETGEQHRMFSTQS